MEDIVKVIFDLYSKRHIDENSNHNKLLTALVKKDNELKASLSPSQLNIYKEFISLNSELETEGEYELIAFVLSFISSIFNYSKKTD